MREATRTDWRFLLGVAPGDVVLTAGRDSAQLARSLLPWVQAVHRLDLRVRADGAVDWVFFSGGFGDEGDAGRDHRRALELVDAAYRWLRPGGCIAITLENPWGLHWLADWRLHDDGGGDRAGRTRGRHGLAWYCRLLRKAGVEDVHTYALLPSRDAPRAIIPMDRDCPVSAQTMALDQVWQRASPCAALVRRVLGAVTRTGLMRRLYPHYLVAGRKPC